MSNLDDRFCGERSVKRDSERSRRDRLNESFVALSRLLPSFEESKVYSKLEVINQARRFICELVEQNRRLLSTENGKENMQSGQIVYLTERVRYLLNRNHQLSAILREAKIRIPSHEDMLKTAKSKRLLAKKMKSEAAAAAVASAASVVSAATTTTASSERTSQLESAANGPDAINSRVAEGASNNCDDAQNASEVSMTATSSSGSSGAANVTTTVNAAAPTTATTTTTNTFSAKVKKSTNDKDGSASDKSTNSSDVKRKSKTHELQVPEKRNGPIDGVAATASPATITSTGAGSVQPPAAIIVVKKVSAKASRKSSSAAIQKIDPRYKILLPRQTTPKVPIPKLGSEKSLQLESNISPTRDTAGSRTMMNVRGMKKALRRSDGKRVEGGSNGDRSSSSNQTDNGDCNNSSNSNREKPKGSLAKKLKTIQQKIVSDRNFEDEIISKESDLQKIKQHLQKNQKLLKDHYSKKKTSESVRKSPGSKQSGHKNYTIDSLCSAQNQSWEKDVTTVSVTGTTSSASTSTVTAISTTNSAGSSAGATAPAAVPSTSVITKSNTNTCQRSSVITRDGIFNNTTQQMMSSSNYDLSNDLLQTLGGVTSSDSLSHHAMASSNASNEPSSSLSPTANFLSHFPLVSSSGGNGTGNVSHPPIVNHSNNGMMFQAITTATTTSTTFGHDICWSTTTTATSAPVASATTGHVPNNDHLIGHNHLAKTANPSLDNNFCSLNDQLNSGDKFYMDLARNSTDFRNMQSLASTEKKLPKDNFLDHFIDREFPQFNEFGLRMSAGGSGNANVNNASASTKSTNQNYFPFAPPHQNQSLPHDQHQQQSQQHASPSKQPKLMNSKPVNWMTTPPHAKNTSSSLLSSSSSSSSSSSALNPFAAPFSNCATQNATVTSAPTTSAINSNSGVSNNNLDFLFQPFGCTNGSNSTASRPSFSLPASNSHSGLKDLVAETSFMETGPSTMPAPSSTTHLIEWSSSSHKYHSPHHYQNHSSQHRSAVTHNTSTSIPSSASSSLLMPSDSLQSSLDLGLISQLPALSSHQNNAPSTLSTNSNNTFNNFSVSHLMDDNSMQLGPNSYQQQSQQHQQQRHHQSSHHHHHHQQQQQQQQQQLHLQHQQTSKQTTFFNPVSSTTSGHKSLALSNSASSSSSSSSNRKNWIDLNFQPQKSFQYSAESLISSHPSSSGISSNAPMLTSNDLWTPAATASSTSSYQNKKMAINHHSHHQASSSTTSYSKIPIGQNHLQTYHAPSSNLDSNNGFAPFAFQTSPAGTTATAASASATSNNDYHDLHLPTNVFDFEACATTSVPSLHHSMIAP